MLFPGEYPNNTKAKIHKCWIEQNVWDGGIVGIRVHIDFEIENGLNLIDQVAAYFYFSNGTSIPDLNGRFRSADGSVAVGGRFNAIYSNSLWTDYVLFIPKHELHVFTSQSLKVSVKVWQGNNILHTKQTQFYFNF